LVDNSTILLILLNTQIPSGIVVAANQKVRKIIRNLALFGAVFPLTHDLEILDPESAAGNFWSKNVVK